ncbi:c-type cytochrome [Deinococcus petrolearius]|uniref:C-type cytochrome n=1 Tax=Deinococcus petrolearius TaxID=1751295 RepID=A0ABW1DGX2_9DEIO
MGKHRRFGWLAIPLFLSLPVLWAGAQGNGSPGGAPQGTPAAGPPPGLTLKFAAPSATRGEALSRSCAGCHGPAGVSTQAGVPGLAGQVPSYTRFQLAVFRAKLRPSEVMQRVAARLSDQDIADLAAYFAAQAPGPAWTADPALRARGAALFQGGDNDRNVIACAVCHGEDGRGADRQGIASVTNLAPEYGLEVLHEFRDTPRFGVPHPDAMRIALKPLSDDDLKALAAYISSMK